MTKDVRLYNPLDHENLADSVMRALFRRATMPLADILEKTANDVVLGAGIYALYYTGPFGAYAPLAEATRAGSQEWPIYIGKADAPGGRTGGQIIDDPTCSALRDRLRDHARSIRTVDDEVFKLADFSCRFLATHEMFTETAESLMISRLMPIWNVVTTGFGNRDPGKNRHQGKLSKWDVLHPGRSWARNLQARKDSVDDVLAEIAANFAARRVDA